MADVVVRVIRTWDVTVNPEWGDTPEDVLASAEVAGDPDVETRVIVPQED